MTVSALLRGVTFISSTFHFAKNSKWYQMSGLTNQRHVKQRIYHVVETREGEENADIADQNTPMQQSYNTGEKILSHEYHSTKLSIIRMDLPVVSIHHSLYLRGRI
jgi:hypothetical protein